MKRTKILIAFFYILNMFVLNALVKLDNDIVAMSLCFLFLLIREGFVNVGLMGELKHYSPKIYEKLKEDKYVNGFKWLGYTLDMSQCTEQDKNIKLCVIADMVLSVIIFIELIIIGTII